MPVQKLQHVSCQLSILCLQDPDVFDSAVDAVVELIYSSSAGGSPHAHQAALMPQLVTAVRSC